MNEYPDYVDNEGYHQDEEDGPDEWDHAECHPALCWPGHPLPPLGDGFTAGDYEEWSSL